MVYYKAVKLNNFVIYNSSLPETELLDFLKSEKKMLSGDDNCDILLDHNLVLFENTEYYIQSFSSESLEELDFTNLGKYYNKNFGILFIKNFIGTVQFKDVIFEIRSKKMSTEMFNDLLASIDKNIKDLAIVNFNETGLAKGQFSNVKNNDYDYFKYIKIFNLLSKNKLLPYFRYIRKNTVFLFKKEKNIVHISSSQNITTDTIMDIFSGETPLTKSTNTNKLSRKLPGYLPEYLNEYSNYLHFNSPENQFIKFFLEYLIANLRRFIKIIEESDNNTFTKHKLSKKTSKILSELKSELNQPFYKSVSVFTGIDSSNTVITKKYGYKHLYKEYININNTPQTIFETDDLIQLYQQKSVDKLYEYIGYFSILNILRIKYSDNIYPKDILTRSISQPFTLNITENSNFKITFAASGKLPACSLFFQRSFTTNNNGSWSVKFEPDFTIEVFKTYNESTFFHFDSKYKKNYSKEMEREKTEDIQKMHSYRDGIINTYGAYILYPGQNISTYAPTEDNDSVYNIGSIPLINTSYTALEQLIERILYLDFE